MKTTLGLIGLGTMGSALAKNLASKGFTLSVWNRTEEKIHKFVESQEGNSFYAPKDFEDFLSSIEKPRKIILMLPAGAPTQKTVEKLADLLDKGDQVLDGGNAHFEDSLANEKKLQEKGIHFLGTGISGGEEGALKGPSIMPGGAAEAYSGFKDALEAIAASDFEGKACVAHLGKGAAGHYVKMVHNGIEYAEMQMLSEAYDLLKTVFKLSHSEIADIFEKWDEAELKSYLTEISVEVLRRKEDGADLLSLILDKAGQKGTGLWTSTEALNLGVPAPSIVSAVFTRGISTEIEKRKQLSKLYPIQEKAPNITLSDFSFHLGKALQIGRVLNFEQGFEILKKADEVYSFKLNFPEISRVWQGGCIIRCTLLKNINKHQSSSKESLLSSDFAHTEITASQKCLRSVVTLAADHSVTIPVLSSSLAYLDAIRRQRLPVNFLQGLRDRFGSHGYERVDQEGKFHTNWT